MASRRRSIGAYVSPQARDGWRLFAASRGVSVSALLEALGVALAELDEPERRLPPLVREALQEARVIDARRRRRDRTEEDDDEG